MVFKTRLSDGSEVVVDGKLSTGFADKNGKELYDGDRVEVSSEWFKIKCEKGTVQYIPKYAAFAVFYDTPDLNGLSEDANGENHNWDDFAEFDEIAVITE